MNCPDHVHEYYASLSCGAAPWRFPTRQMDRFRYVAYLHGCLTETNTAVLSADLPSWACEVGYWDDRVSQGKLETESMVTP
jgi:hypothetical protein